MMTSAQDGVGEGNKFIGSRMAQGVTTHWQHIVKSLNSISHITHNNLVGVET